jgi:hypothetical protein
MPGAASPAAIPADADDGFGEFESAVREASGARLSELPRAPTVPAPAGVSGANLNNQANPCAGMAHDA